MAKKIIRLTLKTLAILTILIALGVGLIFALVDPNDYKDDIESAVKQTTGRELHIPGNIRLTLFPWIGASIGEASLGNASSFRGQGFDEQPFASMRGVDIRINVMPLLHREIEVGTIGLRGLTLNLETNKQGVNNWDDLTATSNSTEQAESHNAPPSAASSTTPAATPPTAPPPITALAIGGIDISDATIIYNDKPSAARHEIQAFYLTTNAIKLATPFDLEGGFRVVTSEPPSQADITYAAQITLDPGQQRYRLSELKLEISATGKTLPTQPFLVTLSGNVDADLAEQNLAIKDLALNVLGLSLSGDISGKNIIDAPQLRGALRSEPFNARDLIATMGEPLKTDDPSALTDLSLMLDFTATTNSATLESLTLAIDQSKLTGNASVTNFAHPAIDFALYLDSIDLDRYLPPASPTSVNSKPATENSEKMDEAPITLPLEMMRALNISGNIKANTLKANKLEFTQLEVGVNAKEGLINIAPLAVNLNEGSLRSSVSVDVRKETPRFALKQVIKNIEVNPLLVLLADTDILAGKTELNANITTQGLTPKEMTTALNGDASFVFRDGAVKGINVAKTLRNGWAKIKGRPVSNDEPNQTDFTQLSGSVKITNGVVNNSDLMASAPLLRITGAGQADLNKERVDYLAKIKVVGTLEGQGGAELDKLRGLTIPISIKGSFTQPKIRPEFDSVLKEQTKQKLNAEKAKIKSKVEQKKKTLKRELEERSKKKLKDLLKF